MCVVWSFLSIPAQFYYAELQMHSKYSDLLFPKYLHCFTYALPKISENLFYKWIEILWACFAESNESFLNQLLVIFIFKIWFINNRFQATIIAWMISDFNYFIYFLLSILYLYSFGVILYFFLNIRLKYERFVIPILAATSVICILVVRRRFVAIFRR